MVSGQLDVVPSTSNPQVALTVRLSRDLHLKAKIKVSKEQTSLQRVVEDAIRAYVGEAPAHPDFQRQLDIARRGMAKYRNTLAELAK